MAAAEPSTEADPMGVYTSLLAGTGVLIGPSPHVCVGNTRHPLLVWPLLFGLTGTGRKGEATNTARLFLDRADETFAKIEETGRSSGEGLIERIKDPAPDDEDDDARRRSRRDTGGTEDKRLLVVESEFSTVLARAKREGSSLAGVLRRAWDGNGLSVLNRSKLRASSSHVAIIGHITPTEFKLRLAETELAGGTYNRFTPVWVERSKRLPLPEGVAEPVFDSLAAKLRSAVGRARKITAVGLSDDARDLWVHDVYEEMTEADDNDLAWAEFARRAAPYCLRVAAMYAALEGRRRISAADLTAAAALVRYSVASARYVLDRSHRDTRLDRITRHVDAAGDKGCSRSEITAMFSRNVKSEELDALIEAMLEDPSYQAFQVSTGGRPATRYRRLLSS